MSLSDIFVAVVTDRVMLVIYAVALVGLFANRLFARWKRSHPKHTKQVPRCGPLHPYLCMSATALSKGLRDRTIRSVELVRIHIDHIQHVNKYVNAMVFDRFELAIQEAKKADAVLDAWQKRGSPASSSPGWLTGVPCTIKECFAVAGCPQSAGHPKRVGVRSSADAPAVARLRKAGVIVLGVTNLSEMCMWMESGNKVYGITCNPYDVRHIVGGSSGGEGCAVASHMAPFGLGSDIGGSIRMPAYFNGVYGHKPSTRLVPNKGQHPGCVSEGHYLLVSGPICRYVEDLRPLMATLTDGGFMEDPNVYQPCSPLALSPSVLCRNREAKASPSKQHVSTPIRVYAFEDLGLLGSTVSAPQRRAIQHCADILEGLPGFEVHRFNLKHRSDRKRLPPGWNRLQKATQMWSTMASRDAVTFEHLMADNIPSGRFPAWREMGKWIVGRSEHTLPAIALCILERLQKRLTPAFMETSALLEAKQLKRDVWRVLADDGVILAPTYPHAPPRHHQPLFMPVNWQYTAVFNLLETPSTAVPVWLDDVRHQRLPLGIQVVSGWGHDTLSLAVAEQLSEHLPGHQTPLWGL